jgi:stress response protein YsnF
MTSQTDKSIPVIEEKYSVFKRKVTQNITIEKRWVKKTKTIQVPLRYEEIFVNGKRISQSGLDSLLSSLNTANQSRQDVKITRAKGDRTKPAVPLDGKSIYKVLPLYGEQIRVSKKMIRYAEAVVSKSRVTENKRIKIELAGEKVMIRYPDETIRTLESTADAPTLSEAHRQSETA